MWLPTLIATKRYETEAAKLLSRDEQESMEFAIVVAPESHPVVPGFKGVRKARWSRAGMGKRGGLRVIYYLLKANGEILLLTVYSKNQKENLTDADKKDILRVLKLHEAQ